LSTDFCNLKPFPTETIKTNAALNPTLAQMEILGQNGPVRLE